MLPNELKRISWKYSFSCNAPLFYEHHTQEYLHHVYMSPFKLTKQKNCWIQREKKKIVYQKEAMEPRARYPQGEEHTWELIWKIKTNYWIKSFSKFPNRTNSIELFLIRLFQKRIARMQSWRANLVSEVCISIAFVVGLLSDIYIEDRHILPSSEMIMMETSSWYFLRSPCGMLTSSWNSIPAIIHVIFRM